MGSAALHAQSKWAIIALSAELARRYTSQGIISTSLHPGSIRNEWHNSLTGIWKWVVDMWVKPTSWGALTELYAGTAPEGAGFSGKASLTDARVYSKRID
ncbi:hypothetical protein FRC08_014251 [Ceratobasidium sp. 394]|nr:hypothetical protein FRC08_014251 [Ceratobasidium sp. 394]